MGEPTRAGTTGDSPDLAAQEWLRNADDKFLACRQRHKFPELEPGRPLPRGARITGPHKDGVMMLVFTCQRGCGAVRRLVTVPSGELDMTASYRYRYGDPRYHAPKGTGRLITPRVCMAESWRRGKEEWLARAKRPPLAEQ